MVGGRQGPHRARHAPAAAAPARPPWRRTPSTAASGWDATWSRVTWTDDQNVVHPIAEYQYRIRPRDGAWTEPTDTRATSAETASMTRTIPGLAAGTWYDVQVRAVNRMDGTAYPGKWSEPGKGRTWGVPDRVEEPAAFLTGAAVEVVWEAPQDGGSAIDDYDVAYKTSDSGGWLPHTYSGCTMDGCAIETSIVAAAKKVRVRAGNSVGMGAWSPTARVQARKLLRVNYGAATASLDEGATLLVTVRLDGAADRPVTVPLTVDGGTGVVPTRRRRQQRGAVRPGRVRADVHAGGARRRGTARTRG